MLDLCAGIRDEIGSDMDAGQLGRFLQSWANLEAHLMSFARQRHTRVFSARQAIDQLAQEGLLSVDLRERLDALRVTRNTAVHHASNLMPGQLAAAGAEIDVLLPSIQMLEHTHGTR